MPRHSQEKKGNIEKECMQQKVGTAIFPRHELPGQEPAFSDGVVPLADNT